MKNKISKMSDSGTVVIRGKKQQQKTTMEKTQTQIH